MRRRIETVGAGGGLILAPAHNMQPDTPVENILAMYGAVRENYNLGIDIRAGLVYYPSDVGETIILCRKV